MGISHSLCGAAICTSLLLTPAVAQTLVTENTCEQTETVGAFLMTDYKEKPLALGTGLVYIIFGDGVTRPMRGMYSLWTNQNTGTFTNTISFSDGITCIIMSGSDFEPYVERRN